MDPAPGAMDADRALRILREHPVGAGTMVIGELVRAADPLVLRKSGLGGPADFGHTDRGAVATDLLKLAPLEQYEREAFTMGSRWWGETPSSPYCDVSPSKQS